MRFISATVVALIAFPALAAEPALPESAVARLGGTKFRTSGTGIVLSPDGTRAAVRVGDGIDVLNLDTGEVVAQLRDEKELKHPKYSRGPHWFTFAFAAGGKEIVTAIAETEVAVWDATTGKPLRSIGGLKGAADESATILGVFNCQLADFLIAETTAGWQKLDAKTGKWAAIRGGYDRISDVSPDGRWVTDYTDMASVENYVGVTDTKDNVSAYSGESGGSYPFSSAPSPDGKFVACTVSERGVQLWEIATKKEIALKDVDPKISHGNPLFSPDGKVLLVDLPSSPYDDKTPPHLARWNTATGERLPDWKLPARLSSWAVDHKNNRLIVIAGQCVFRIDIATGKFANPPDGFTGRARPAVSPDGKLVAAGDDAGALRVWKAPFTGKPRTLRDAGSPVHDLVFSQDGKALFVGHEDRTATVWDAVTGKQAEVLKPPAKDIRGKYYTRPLRIAVSPDGQTLAAVVDTERLWAWDVPRRKVLWELKSDEKGEGITGCRPVFAPDGSALYYGRDKGEISKFDPRTGKELARIAAPVELKTWVTRLAISPDGKQLAAHTYYNNGELVLFDIEKGSAIWRQTFKLEEAVGGLSFTTTGLVVTTNGDGTVRGWDAATGKRTFTLRGPAGYVERLQFTADGKFAVTDAPGATALVWKLK